MSEEIAKVWNGGTRGGVKEGSTMCSSSKFARVGAEIIHITLGGGSWWG